MFGCVVSLGIFTCCLHFDEPARASFIIHNQKPISVEMCNGSLCAGKQASEYSIS